MRVVLVRPTSTLHQTVPPLGILSLGSFLRQECPGVEVRLFDQLVLRWSLEKLVGQIVKLCPDLVGISAINFEAPGAWILAEALYGRVPNLILGGPYASMSYSRILERPEFDACVIGEGEETIVQLVRELDSGRLIGDLDLEGTAVRGREGVRIAAPRTPIQDMDRLPCPDFSLLPLERYFQPGMTSVESSIQLSRRALPIMTSRGCPHNCVFCFHNFGKKFRARSAEKVVSDLEEISSRYQVDEFHFSDDAFAQDSRRVFEIARLIEERGLRLRFSFSGGLRVDNLTAEMIAAMKAMGTYQVKIGIESAAPSVLEKLQKGIDLAQVENVIDELTGQGILTGGFFMLGLPNEREEDFRETVRFACRSKLHMATFHVCHVFPGSPLDQQVLQQGGEAQRWTVEGLDYGSCPINVSKISSARLEHLRRWALRRFYIDPRRMVRLLRVVPKKRVLMNPAIDLVAYVWGRRRFLSAGS